MVMMEVPDRLSSETMFDYFTQEQLDGIKIAVNGTEVECVEYCISERWAICHVFNEKGKLLITNENGQGEIAKVKIYGLVEVKLT